MRVLAFLSIATLLLLAGCSRTSDKSLKMTGVTGGKGLSIITIDIDANTSTSLPLDCYALGSSLFDPGSRSYGYIGCDSVLTMLDPISGRIVKSLKLPGLIGQPVIDSQDNYLIGRYTGISYEDVPDSTKSVAFSNPVLTDYVITIDLNTGAVVSKKLLNIPEGVEVCGYFFNKEEQLYVLIPGGTTLVSINPFTGEHVRSVSPVHMPVNMVYDDKNNTVTGLGFGDNGNSYIEVIDEQTGQQISKHDIVPEDSFILCSSAYDSGTGIYSVINGKNELLIIDSSTGEIKNRIQLDGNIFNVKLWR
jgi:hypothetical protein